MNFFNRAIERAYSVEEKATEKKVNINSVLKENLDYLKSKFGNSFDLLIRETSIGDNDSAFVICDGMCDMMFISESVIKPILMASRLPEKPEEQLKYISKRLVTDIELCEVYSLDKVIDKLTNGFVVLFINGADYAVCLGVQGYKTRGIDEPSLETQERGSRESFTENFKTNVGMIRRRLKTPQAQFEMMQIGKSSKTNVYLCYMTNRVEGAILSQVKRKLSKIDIDTVFESGYIQHFLDYKGHSFFSGVGVTERPDTLCAKITEGRIGIIVDGTPFALVVPYLFIENFHNIDDYSTRPYYAFFIRSLKFLSFVLAVFMPGLYVSVVIFHQEMLPPSIIFDVMSAHAKTPFPVMVEALVIHFIYEIMREAGLRLPKSIGHAVSIVGGLVIGEAAVSAGIIAPPMLIIVALTALASFVIPQLYQPVSVLRLIFIIIGGTMGIFGLMMGAGLLVINMSAISPYGVSYLSPFTPFELAAMRDTVYRSQWQNLSKRNMKIQNLKGVKK
ncbi:MAG: spore germination protein [Clostridiales bacterium]|nr:spore germination protein [Clostridiales bacterium]